MLDAIDHETKSGARVERAEAPHAGLASRFGAASDSFRLSACKAPDFTRNNTRAAPLRATAVRPAVMR